MDPLTAAATIFEQAAEGRFYLLTQNRRGGYGRTSECPCVATAPGLSDTGHTSLSERVEVCARL